MCPSFSGCRREPVLLGCPRSLWDALALLCQSPKASPSPSLPEPACPWWLHRQASLILPARRLLPQKQPSNRMQGKNSSSVVPDNFDNEKKCQELYMQTFDEFMGRHLQGSWPVSYLQKQNLVLLGFELHNQKYPQNQLIKCFIFI